MITIADFVGADKTVPITTPDTLARQVYFVVTGTNATGQARVGDSTVNIAKGLPLLAGASPVILRPMTDAGGNVAPYSLGAMYLYIPSAVKVSVAYEPWN